MLDERIIQGQEFMKDEKFIKLDEFKTFLYKIKQNELTLQLQPDDSVEKRTKFVQRLQDYDPSSEGLTTQEARELVARSSMLLFLGRELS